MIFAFVLPIFYEVSIVCGPAMVPVNMDLFDSVMDHTTVDGTMLAPSTLEEISKNPESLARMAKTEFTATGGGKFFRSVRQHA